MIRCIECSNRLNSDEFVVVWSDPHGHYDSEYMCTGCFSYKSHELEDQRSEPTFAHRDDTYEESED